LLFKTSPTHNGSTSFGEKKHLAERHLANTAQKDYCSFLDQEIVKHVILQLCRPNLRLPMSFGEMFFGQTSRNLLRTKLKEMLGWFINWSFCQPNLSIGQLGKLIVM
jgi:hypothetical protein